MAQSHPRQQLRYSLMIVLVFAVVSTVGFFILGRVHGIDRSVLQCLYLTVNIFSTVGNWSDRLSWDEKLWEILMCIFGIGASFYALGAITALLTSGEMRRALGRRNLVDKIKSIQHHYIICGFGRMGQSICQELTYDQMPFVLIDLDPDKTAIADSLGYTYLLGEASDEKVLEQAGIERAKGLVACLPHDADNVFVTLTARSVNENLNIISRAERADTEPRLLRAGANRVVCAPVIGALKITRMLLHPAVEDIVDATEERHLSIDRIAASDISGAVGRSLRELALPKHHGVMVLAVTQPDGTRLFNPPADHVLAEDDRLIVAGPRAAVDNLIPQHP